MTENMHTASNVPRHETHMKLMPVEKEICKYRLQRDRKEEMQLNNAQGYAPKTDVLSNTVTSVKKMSGTSSTCLCVKIVNCWRNDSFA